MPEIPIFSEKFPVVGRDHYPSVRREGVKELGEDAVQISERIYLPVAELAQLGLVEELLWIGRVRLILLTVVEALEDAVYA